MGIQLGDVAPDFVAPSTIGRLSFHEYLGNNWGVLVSYPKSFTPVSQTELTALAKAEDDFKSRNVKIVSVSIDSAEENQEWKNNIEASEKVTINFPLVSDRGREIINQYDMMHPNIIDTMTLRDTFIINPSKMLMLRLTYPVCVGRNINELIRVIDALQVTAQKPIATPANWEKGDACVLLPSVSEEEAKKLFPNGVDSHSAYFKTTYV